MTRFNTSKQDQWCNKLQVTTRGLVCFLSLLVVGGVTYADTSPPLSALVIETFGAPPAAKEGQLNKEIVLALETAFGENLKTQQWGPDQTAAIKTLGDSQDSRVAWLLSDMMRIAGSQPVYELLAEAISNVLGITFENQDYWNKTTNHLMAWNIPAPPNYLVYKRNIFLVLEPAWDKLFVEGNIDWRHVSWGGVRIDNREYNKTDARCNCIPASDNPPVSSASETDWLKDDDIVFGIELNGEYRAYPRRIMEVREMINDTLGGRDLAIPYCTLCGAAQAYFTDDLPDGIERPVLRTSGLLIRSNKVMYDVNTFSVFDTFLGHAVTGPLSAKNLKLTQANVVTTEWGRWKAAYPETTVLDESVALGRDFDFRNTRDANGPIFPVGDVDPRLPIQEDVIGLISSTGVPIAFPVNQAKEALLKGEKIQYENITLVLDAGGVKAVNESGESLGSHQSFWFAWSQFHPDTQLWSL